MGTSCARVAPRRAGGPSLARCSVAGAVFLDTPWPTTTPATAPWVASARSAMACSRSRSRCWSSRSASRIRPTPTPAGRRFHLPLMCVNKREVDRAQAYDWLGNVRELQHVVERAVIVSPHNALSLDLPRRTASPTETGVAPESHHSASVRTSDSGRGVAQAPASERLGCSAANRISDLRQGRRRRASWYSSRHADISSEGIEHQPPRPSKERPDRCRDS